MLQVPRRAVKATASATGAMLSTSQSQRLDCASWLPGGLAVAPEGHYVANSGYNRIDRWLQQ